MVLQPEDQEDVEELIKIEEKDQYIEIGGAVTFTEIVEGPLSNNLKGLIKAASLVGSPQIRNKGTVGGNICNGSPAADTVPPLMALDSILILGSKEGTREISLTDFYLDKGRVNLNDNEVLVKIRFKKPQDNQKLGFSKLGLRKALAISRICTSVFIEIEDDKVKTMAIANGSLGKHALREVEVEEFFVGKALDDITIEEGAELLSKVVEERLNGRSSMEYKKEAVKATFKEAVFHALQD